MSYELKKKEQVRAGVRRIAREEIDKAVELLRDRKTNPGEAVHKSRKHLKKVRALFRIVRDDLGEKVFEKANHAMRDEGRQLGPVRDAVVLVDALEKLQAKHPEAFPAQRLGPIRRKLVSRRTAALGRLKRERTRTKVARDLEKFRQHVRVWPFPQEGFRAIEPGLRRSFRRGRKAKDEAWKTHGDAELHEWRKRVKDLRYHVELLQPMWPKEMEVLEKELHDLTDRLGDDHDLAELRIQLAAMPGADTAGHGVASVIEQIDKRRAVLQSEAAEIDGRIYGEKPRAFSRRISAYWDSWRGGAS